jgi:2-methylcitrate dehydratase PrpD
VSQDLDPGYRDALLDWMACAVGGRGEPAARAAKGAGEGLQERVTAAATAGHVLDFDDTYLPGVAHLSAPCAPVALVLGGERGAGVGETLAAYAAGFEAMGALARASHPALYDGGWHPTAVCGALGAAVTAARLLSLDADTERSAAALGLLRAAGLRSAFGSAGKSLQVGMAAATGVAAAKLAAAGVRLDLEQVALGQAGFEEAFRAGFGRLNGQRAIEANWIKAYPCCLQTHGAIEAALDAREAIDPAAASIEVTVHPLSLQAAPVVEPGDGLQAKFSIPYLTALALLRGTPAVASFESIDAGAAQLGRQIAVKADPALAESEAQLAVDGELVARVEAALGSPQRPLSAERLAKKRRGLAGERLEGALDDPRRPTADLLDALDP